MKSRILIWCSIGFAVVTGAFSAVLFSGYFGTYQNPSPQAIQLMKRLGVKKPIMLKLFLDGLLTENIKIPYHFLRGQFSKPEGLFIDISEKDYQGLAGIRNKSLQAGAHFASEEEGWFPATIRHQNREVRVKLRLKGDLPDHFDGNKWSLRIKIKDKDNDRILGMKTFSLQHPKTRFFLSEFLYHETLQREGVMSLRYDFVYITLNGLHKGIYALEEHFDEPLAEYNNRRKGVFLKFNEESFRHYVHLKELLPKSPSGYDLDPNFYAMSEIQGFRKTKLLQDPEKRSQFETAKNLLESFRTGRLKTHDVFDIDKMAKYAAITTLFGTQHGSSWHNIRFFFNSETFLLEPVGFDAGPNISYKVSFWRDVLSEYFPPCLDNSHKDFDIDSGCTINSDSFFESLFSDSLFFQKYVAELERVSQKEYLDELFAALDEKLNDKLDVLYRDFPFYHFSRKVYYENQEAVREILNPTAPLQAYHSLASGRIKLTLNNVHPLPIEILYFYLDNNFPLEHFPKNIVLQPYSSQRSNQRVVTFKMSSHHDFEESAAVNFRIHYKVFGTTQDKQQAILSWSSSEKHFSEWDNNSR